MGDMKKCPYCGEEIPAKATRCKYCREWLTDVKPAAEPRQPELPDNVEPASDKPEIKTPKSSKSMIWLIVGVVAAVVIGLAIALLFKKKNTDSSDKSIIYEQYEEAIPDIPPTPPAPEIEIQDAQNSGIEVVSNYDEENDATPFNLVFQKPKFNGEDANAFSRWVQNNIPYSDIDAVIAEGTRSIYGFTIDIDGSVKDVKVIRSDEPAFDDVVLSILSRSPKWSPGRNQEDEPVKVSMTFPVFYRP